MSAATCDAVVPVNTTSVPLITIVSPTAYVAFGAEPVATTLCLVSPRSVSAVP